MSISGGQFPHDQPLLHSDNEDTVQCYFFFVNLHKTLDSLCTQLNETISELSKAYLWHRDDFRVHLPVDVIQENVPPYLISSTCFGDNIEDEWFIVYLIYEITKIYKDLVVKVVDNDGDFLLIEAADYLPSWANPENTENRVFIYNNCLHIIPPFIMNEEDLELGDAIKTIVNSKLKTVVEPEVQEAIRKRIAGYPDKIQESLHKALVYLPLDLATLLSVKPSLISPIVSAYCGHDMIDAKLCKDVNLDNTFSIPVIFTKCLYAMLMHSKLIKTSKIRMFESDKRKVCGFKLLCGYKIILNKPFDIFNSKEFNKFLNSLKQNGYFKGNIEGSKDYNLLLKNAKEFFQSIESSINSQASHDISQIMNSEKYLETKELLQKKSKQLNIEEDSDDWLNIQPEHLNDLLNNRYGKQTKLKNNDIISSESLKSELSNFLNQQSGFEGIESCVERDIDETNIEFDVDDFSNCINKMLNIISSGRDISDNESDISEEMEEDGDNQENLQKDNYLDQELKNKLVHGENGDLLNSKNILFNITQSLKEEQASSGPSSNLMRSIGITKSELLDSDDEE